MVLVAGGCGLRPWGGSSPAPEVREPRSPAHTSGKRPAVHVVRRGENLSSIAWRYGLDYRSIARWNRIAPPYVIHPGQKLALRGSAPAGSGGQARGNTTGAGAKRPAAPAAGGWIWPAPGRLIRGFGKGEGGGIDIAGRRGDPVVAAQGGRVVYAGSGLVGYGRLVIIKHGDRLLTAYAHNDRVLVKEGQKVRKGQKLAEMGSTGAERVKLHFEVRRDGKPLNPMKYLPRRS